MKIEEKELVIARLQTIPSNIRISMGETYNRAELIEEVENETMIGEKIVQMHMEYLKALSNGELFKLQFNKN